MTLIPVNRFHRMFFAVLVAVGLFTAVNISKDVFHSFHIVPNSIDINVIESHAQYKYITREEDGSVNIVFHVLETSPIAKFLREKFIERNCTAIHHLMQASTTQLKELSTTKAATTTGKLDNKPKVKISYPLTVSGSPYLLNNDKICTGVHNLTFIVMVHTATDHFYRRSVIRETWANKDLLRNYSMRVLFLLGRPQDKKVQATIEHESSVHRDIVQGNFVDTYHNLTHKGVLGFRWISEFCPQAKFLVKVDDDVFVNVFKLLLDMSKSYNADKRKIRCYVRMNGTSPIQRNTGKWRVDDWEFINMTHFPVTYCNGFFVLMTTDIIKELYEASKKTPFFWVDDVYIFGLLPANVGSVTFESVQGLNLNQKQALECFRKGEPCDYLAATAVDKGNMETLCFGVVIRISIYLKQVYKLEKESELRFELDEQEKTSVYLEILDGMAEVFGTELELGRKYRFYNGAKAAVYTWHGCQIKLTGKTEAAYISKNTPMVTYLNIHIALEQMRVKSEKERVRGPRVMVVGPPDVGKSSFCRLLLNYAARIGRTPLFVDLDVEQNDLSIPGTVGVLRVMRPADVEEAFECPPLVFHHGHIRPATNLKLYNGLVSRVADAVNIKCDASTKANLSGVIVNTGSCEDGADYNSLKYAAGAFEVDIIIVLGQEKLSFKLKRDVPSFVQIVQLSKTGGVVQKCQSYRDDRIERKIREYFYGNRCNIFPHRFEVKFSEVQLFKFGAPELPESCLPFGMRVTDRKKRTVSIQPSESLLHHVFSVSSADSPEQNLVEMNVLGFVVMMEINLEKQCFRVLSPCPGPLPKSILLQSDLRFMDIR